VAGHAHSGRAVRSDNSRPHHPHPRRGRTHGPKDPHRAGRISLHEVGHAIEGKTQPVKQFGGADTRSVVLDTGTLISSWRSSMAGYTMLACNRQPRRPRHFSNSSATDGRQSTHLDPARGVLETAHRHRLRDNGSAIRNLRWALVPSGVRPAASRPPVITRPHRTRECASAADPVRVGAPAQTHDSSSWRPRRSATLCRPLVRRSNGSPAFLGVIRFRARDDAGQVSWPPTGRNRGEQ
jgi:hypothetical protein